MVGFAWQDDLSAAALHLHELLTRSETEACCTVTVLSHHHANAGIREQFQELGAALVESRRSFTHRFCDLITMRSSRVFETLPLPLSILFLIGGRDTSIQCHAFGP